jgi:copper(I)-binding protein
MAILDPSGSRYLMLTGLREELRPGQSVMMTFRFDNGVEIETSVSIAVPNSALPRSPLDLDKHE